MLYLAPIDDPEDYTTEAEEQSSFIGSNQRERSEYKGFQRKMGEMEFWKSIICATALALFLSMFDSMDIEIYWPLLVMYFCMMTVFLFRAKLAHMIKYQYTPWDAGQKVSYSKKKPDLSTQNDLPSHDDV